MTFFLADLKHELALWSGTREDIEERAKSIRNRCYRYGIAHEFDEHVRIISSDEIDELEMDYMLTRLRVPRRVRMRLCST